MASLTILGESFFLIYFVSTSFRFTTLTLLIPDSLLGGAWIDSLRARIKALHDEFLVGLTPMAVIQRIHFKNMEALVLWPEVSELVEAMKLLKQRISVIEDETLLMEEGSDPMLNKDTCRESTGTV